MLQRFINVFAVPAYKLKNIHNVKELINFGKIAAYLIKNKAFFMIIKLKAFF